MEIAREFSMKIDVEWNYLLPEGLPSARLTCQDGLSRDPVSFDSHWSISSSWASVFEASSLAAND